MLNSIKKSTISQIAFALMISAISLLYSCTPTSSTSSIRQGSTTAPNGNTGTTTTYGDPTFPLDGIFLQESAVQTKTNFNLPVDFSDSFLIRGKSLSTFLRTVPVSTKFCLTGNFTYISGTNRFLVLAAKPKLFTDTVKKTTEFYLQVEPSNDTANQNDCLTYNLTNTLFSNIASPTAHFSLAQLCANCTTSVTSSGLKLFFINGEEVPSINVSSLVMTISGSSSNTVNSCSNSAACQAKGFDCCLESQCVQDGALRPGAMSQPGFPAAQEDVRLNPNRFLVYPQFYFVCESRPDSGGGSGGGTNPPTSDPDYDAQVQLMELRQLYNCVNKVDGEFGHCTLKYPNASASMPGRFSASNDGFTDDVNFSSLNPALGLGDRGNNIAKIVYAGQTVYQENTTPLTNGSFVSGTANDNLTTAQAVDLNLPLPSNAKDSNLYITYKVDGTCELLSASVAKCSKTYIQSSNDPKETTYHDNSRTFNLPAYADLSSTSNVIVKVSGIVVPEDANTWSKSSSPNRIVFSSVYSLYQNQSVEITYFVKSGASDLVKLKKAAQDKVNSMCSCASATNCNLKPVYDTTNVNIVSYECSYPTSTGTEPPVNQQVYVSNKNIAHRYFDENGVSYDENSSTAPVQEGNVFTYTNNDLLKPNNVTQDIGFNEIYGSFSKSGTYVAKPAKMVRVKKDKLYDFIVSTGGFSSCVSCGSDYYSSLQKIFPSNFAGVAGGYAPDYFETRRENNASIYRPDDLLYGRACFVPATMIPWTHTVGSLPRDQRRSRLTAQHFLFANGYNRDWYGFDYGSLIGSFDGVTWFSIGNARRIKATSSKLYLAVNAYLGDLNIENNFNVSVMESSIFSSDIADHDTETDGAQCQKAHFCSNDNDCFRTLGYDYSCQNVTSLQTTWPQFDANGSEIVGSVTKTVASLVGGTNGQAKRCMYRGRGAPCLANLDTATSTTTYSGSSVVGTLTCSPNNSCLPLTTTGRFNDRISRFANTPSAQNSANASATKSDTVGLGARIILRPYDYYGNANTPSAARTVLNQNNITAICVPGKDVINAADNFDLNQRHPSSRIDSSDKILGIGTTLATMNAISLNACPATDPAGTSMQTYDVPINSPILSMYTITQNMSSNLMDLAPLRNQNIFSSTGGSQITSVGYQRNSCLRAPGASCFSDMDCAPSTFAATKAKTANLSSILNTAEAKFWEEELVCGNPDFEYVNAGALNPNFDIKKNKCCREFGKTMTVYTQTATSAHEMCDPVTNNVKVAGVSIPFSDASRYSRTHTAYDKMTCDRTQISSTKSFALSIEAPDATTRMQQILGQYKTLDTINQRTCCTSHWVRSFATENGGGHSFAKTKMQSIDKAIFKHISWSVDNETSVPPVPPATEVDSAFECNPTQFTNVSCEIKSLTPAEESKYLSFAGALELIGIPQVAIKTNDQVFKLVDDNQNFIAPGAPLTDTDGKAIMLPSSVANADFQDSSGLYYSAANYTQMNMTSGSKNTLKKVFSENEFNCCIPSGQELPDTATASQCCTGFIANVEGPKRCCLPDFTDLTVYTNRYVSSEGRGLPDSAYDSSTGYIKDPGQVKLIAAQKNLCCSGKAMTGVAISQLSIPLTGGTYRPADSSSVTRRFNYRTDAVDNNPETGSVGSLFDAGVRWNDHVYCVPDSLGN